MQILTKGDGSRDFDLLDENDWYGITLDGIGNGKDPLWEARVDALAEAHKRGNTENETGLRWKRSVWSIATRGYQSGNGNHYATFPTKLAENCILAGCREGGTVLDPFIGSGTVAEVALSHGRNCVGVEINQEYKALIEERIQKGIEIHEKHG